MDEAIQYAPEAPMSEITERVGLFNDFIVFAISEDATGEPPGEFISKIIAFIPESFSAFSMNSIISIEEVPCVPNILVDFSV